MLASEEARARLEAIADPGWREAALARAGTLPKALRPTAEAFLQTTDWIADEAVRDANAARLATAAIALDEMSDADRERLLVAVHPELGADLAAWWVAARRWPYTIGWARRSYRAPNDPASSRSTRRHDLDFAIDKVGPYHHDATWLAGWGGYVGMGSYGSAFALMQAGPLLAAAIDREAERGERAVLDELLAVAAGEHPIAAMDRHVVVALLRCAQPEAWDAVERLLLAAQREEGLRQVILEAADEGHPDAFARILDLVLDRDLLRFAAAMRAAGVWLGFVPDAAQPEAIVDHVGRLRGYLADPTTVDGAIADGGPWDVYTALVATAMGDVAIGLDRAAAALARPERDVRAAAVHFLGGARVCRSHDLLLAATADEDVVVAALAATSLPMWSTDTTDHPGAFEDLEALLARLPEKARAVEGVGVEVYPVTVDRAVITNRMLGVIGERELGRLVPWIPAMDPMSRADLARRAGQAARLDDDVRSAVLKLVGDRSPDVRQRAVEAMSELTIDAAEAETLEPLLTRKAGDLRRGVIALLGSQPVDAVIRSAERLWARGGEGRRDAVGELLGTVSPPPEPVVAAARAFLDDDPTDRQREALEAVVGATPVTEIDEWLGIHDPSGRTPPTTPTPAPERRFATDATRRLVDALDDVAEQHRDTPFMVRRGDEVREQLLADIRGLRHPASAPPDDPDGGLVLASVFRPWWDGRPAELRDVDDGIDGLRGLAVLHASLLNLSTWGRDGIAEWIVPLWAEAVGGAAGELRHRGVVTHVLQWALTAHAHEGVVDECLDAVEATLAVIPPEQHLPLEDERRRGELDWRTTFRLENPWHRVLGILFEHRRDLFDDTRLRRWLGLRRWIDQPTPRSNRERPPTGLVTFAHGRGVATDDDLYDALFHDINLLRHWTRHRRQAALDGFPAGVVLADRLRDRVLDVELHRGDLATPATWVVRRIGSIHGAEVALDLLHRLGRASLIRGYLGTDESREASFSHLLRVSYPAPDDTAETVADIQGRLGLTDVSLVELAMFAPQWTTLVGDALGWDGLADAVWWYHAHTKDERWTIDVEVRETWALLSAERTALSGEDLVAGAVDVDWFTRAHTALGPERWAIVHDAAKLAGGGNGHTRAKLYADALVGVADPAAVRAKAVDKRNQDAIRALGLLPLPAEADRRRAEALDRYQVLREIERGASRFGAQRQASERTAVRIAIENLARTIGARDPQRFVWAMEAEETADLADGPISASEGDVTVTLSIDDEGVAQLAVDRAGKPLKAIPAAVRKVPALAALRDRKTTLTRQVSRVRTALETAMTGRDPFADDDLSALGRHPLVAPLLALVVFVDEQGRTMRPVDGRWRGLDGKVVRPKGERRIAHPIDLVASGDWPGWQERLFVEETRQPFKQVFRELYVLTDAERDEGLGSRRWEGHQVQPRQALALFGTRGWVADREGGEVVRVFHGDDVVARVGFLHGWGTPAEVELPTLDRVRFTRRGSYRPLPLDQVPPVVFSEAMRDLDLVASVAHAGGVDPEASASTVDMRAALVRETARLLKLDNVREVSRHIVIEGVLGEYSVHLGSGTVHRRPGGAVCIIPVDSQRRGRIFLPFADDDPKTAEVVAKVLLLARDTEIKDPTILAQLRS